MHAVVLILLVAMLAAPGAGEVHYVVAPGGNDANPGTREQPFGTVQRARDAVRQLKREKGMPAGGITVILRGGTYRLDRPFVLEAIDGGSADSPVRYRAADGEEVRMSGGVELRWADMRPVTDEGVLRRLRSEARPRVRQLDLRAAGITSFGKHRQAGHGHPVEPAPLELFCDNIPMPLARYPDSGAIMIGSVLDPGSVPRIGDYANIRGGKFVYTDPRHADWVGVNDVWFQGYFHYGFADDNIRVAAIDTAGHSVTMAFPHMYGINTGEPFNQYVALNLMEEITRPGEWYLDRATGILYFWPPAGAERLRLSVSVLEEPVVVFSGVSHCSLEGVAVELGRGMGLSVEGGSHVTIAGCTVRNVGTCGIFFGQGARQTFPHVTADDYEGVPVSRAIGAFQMHYYKYTTWERNAGTHHRVVSCDISQTGAGGITLGGGSKKELVSGQNEVVNCRIHDYNRRYKAQWPGVSVDGCGNNVAHNEIFDADLQAIFVRGNDHIFEYNSIHHVALNSNDASAWYLGRDPSDQGNIVRYNFFHHVGRPDRKWTMGVYCDDATCGVTITGNVFYRVASYGTVYSNGGHDIVVRNNIFVDGYGPVFQLKSMWYDFGMFQIPYFFGPDGVYRRRLTRDLNIKQPPYSIRYPLLRDWFDLMPDGTTIVGMLPRRNLFEANVISGYEETFRLVGEHAQCTFRDNFITQGDPGFVDAAALNFQLKDTSEVYRRIPSFERIPFEAIGLYRDEYRRTMPVDGH